MRTATRLLLLVGLVAAGAGCRQSDGPIPTPTADQSNEIGDIARDMVNVANKDPQAPEDLRTDLAKYADTPDAERRINDLAQALAQALVGARLTDDTAKSLANVVWVAVNGRDLSERQVEALQKELRTVLSTTGVTEQRAETIGTRLGEVQQVVSENRRRWYQVF